VVGKSRTHWIWWKYFSSVQQFWKIFQPLHIGSLKHIFKTLEHIDLAKLLDHSDIVPKLFTLYGFHIPIDLRNKLIFMDHLTKIEFNTISILKQFWRKNVARRRIPRNCFLLHGYHNCKLLHK